MDEEQFSVWAAECNWHNYLIAIQLYNTLYKKEIYKDGWFIILVNLRNNTNK